MAKYVLLISGIISMIYGIMILQIGSGTKFWLIWEVIGVFFIVWTMLIHIDFFASHKIISLLFLNRFQIYPHY